MALHTKQRVIAQIPVHIYQALSQAAELSGANLQQFMIQSAFEKAQSVIEKERVIRSQRLCFSICLRILRLRIGNSEMS